MQHENESVHGLSFAVSTDMDIFLNKGLKNLVCCIKKEYIAKKSLNNIKFENLTINVVHIVS